jgi:hypothetical protein
LLSAFYFVFFSKNTLEYSLESEYFTMLTNKTNFEPDITAASSDFYRSIHDHFVAAKSTYASYFSNFFWTILINIPIFVLFVYIWASCILSEQNKWMKCIYFLSAVVPLVSIPAFIMFIDWGRWMIMLLNSQFMLLFYFIYKKEASVLKMSDKITKKSFLIIFACMLMICLGPTRDTWASENVCTLLARLNLM